MDDNFKKKNHDRKEEQIPDDQQENLDKSVLPDEEQADFCSQQNVSAFDSVDQKMIEHLPPEKESPEQSPIDHSKVVPPFRIIEREDVVKYSEKAVFMEEIPLDGSLFCVMNVEDYWLESPIPTLAFYEDGLIIKTNESSSAVMNRLFSGIGFRYESMRSLLNISLGKTCHCQPYIYGNHCFLPLNGPIKRSVTWINLNHLTSYRRIAGDRQKVRMDFHNRHTLDAFIRYQTFEKHLQLACDAYCKQHRYYFNFSNLLGYEIIGNHQLYRDSILHQRLELHKVSTPVLNGEDLIRKARKVLWRDFMKATTLRTHPYFHEINEDLERRYFTWEPEKDKE